MVTKNRKQGYRFLYHEEPVASDFILDLSLSKNIVKHLTEKLNTLHKVSYSNAYWDALLLPNVQLILERLYDRFLFFSSIEIKSLEAPSFKNIEKIFLSYDGCELFSQDEVIEAMIQSKVIAFLKNNGFEGDKKLVLKETILDHPLNFMFGLKEKIKAILRPINFIVFHKSIQKSISNESQFYLREFIPNDFLDSKTAKKFMPLSKLSELILGRRFFFDLINRFKLNQKKKLSEFRHSSSGLNALSQTTDPIDQAFIKFLNLNFKFFLPAFSIERFALFNNSLEIFKPQFLITDSASYFDEFSRHIIAKAKANEAKILVFQHGGGVGLDTKDSISKIEREICTQFIGWTNLYNDLDSGIIFRKSIFESIPKKIDLKRNLDQPNNDILIIGPWFKEFHTYNHALHPAEHESLSTILINLIQHLKRRNLKIEYRPYKFREDIVSLGANYKLGSMQNIHDQILQSSIVVCTALTTHLAECILLNKYPLLIITERAFNSFIKPVQETLIYLQSQSFLFMSHDEMLKSQIFSSNADLMLGIDNPSDEIKNAFHDLIGYNLGSKYEFDMILESFLNKNFKE